MKAPKWLFFVLLGLSLTTSVRADEDLGFRLKAIESKQDEILAKLAEIRSEIEIVKVRSTR